MNNKFSEVTSKIRSKLPTTKKQIKMPPTLLLLLGVITFIVVLTWVIPSGYYSIVQDKAPSEGYEDIEMLKFYGTGQNMFGIIDIFWATGEGFADAGSLIFYLMMSGALFSSVTKSGSLESSIGSLLKKFNGREIFLVPIIMVLFSIPGMIWGFAEETLVFYTMIIPVFIIAGFDAVTGFLVVMIGAGVGTLSSVTNPFMIGIAVDSSNVDGLEMGTGIIFRIITYLVLLLIATIFVTMYAWKVKKDISKSSLSVEERKEHLKLANDSFSLKDIAPLTKRNKAVISLFIFAIIMMFIVNLPWDQWGVDFPGWGNIVNEKASWWTRVVPGFGDWGFIELGMMFLMFAIVINIAAGETSEGVFNNITDGAKDMLGVSLVIAFARGVSQIMDGTVLESNVQATFENGVMTLNIDELKNIFGSEFATIFENLKIEDLEFLKTEGIIDYEITKVSIDPNGDFILEEALITISTANGISPTILNSMSNGMSNFNSSSMNVVSYFIFILISFLIPSSSGLATLSMPIMGPLGAINDGSQGAAGIVTSMSHASGFVNLITPTSGVLMGGLAMCHIPYGKYIKAVWPLLIILFISSLLILSFGGISIDGGYLIGQ